MPAGLEELVVGDIPPRTSKFHLPSRAKWRTDVYSSWKTYSEVCESKHRARQRRLMQRLRPGLPLVTFSYLCQFAWADARDAFTLTLRRARDLAVPLPATVLDCTISESMGEKGRFRGVCRLDGTH